ncbi:MAG TPA: PSD1 and planctomycete cytochrome C domain-containing protein [Verrucomicrobiae bacterium]|jgi:hypothetical protein|nr:PSD1 and planctomycete cytochrome C domain-containing protein [Verrucomicrobiae bacterium]
MSKLLLLPHTARWSVLALVLGGALCVGAADLKKVQIPIRPIDLKQAVKISYARDIRPLLSADCDECHSADDHKAGFDVSTVATLIKGGKKGGPGIVPGKPDQGSVVKYLRGLAEGPQMPKGETPLSEKEVHLIRSWIAAGAVDDSANAPALADADAVPTNAASSLSASAVQHWADVLIFSQDKNEQFAARRALRLGLVAPAPPPPKVDGPAFNDIDKFVLALWSSAKLPQAKNSPSVCDDTTFVRRVYLDVIGVIPTAEQSRQFVAEKSLDKRNKLVDSLLARTNDYAAHWTPFWEDALASQPTMGGVGTHGDYTDFIYKSFLANKPYDLMVAEILDPMAPGYEKSKLANANGKTNVIGFVRNQTHTDTIQTAANTAQIFLGTGMKCASCHNHFLNKEWPQARFTAFAGLFATNDLELIRCEKHSGHFVAAAFPFDLPDAPRAVPKDLNERLHYMTTRLIDPANPRFAKTIVNRLWKRYLGLGLFEPVDDYRLDRAASNPPLLNWLADDFMRHNYDLKHTIRLILTSRTYQLRYDPSLEDHFEVQNPDQPRFARSPSLRRLTAEQFVDSLHEAAAVQWDTHRLFRSVTSTAFTRAVGKPAARNEICTARSDDVAVVQSLELLNGTELHDLTYNGEILDELASQTDRKRIVDDLYWTVLSRPPTSRELELGLDYLHDSQSATPSPTLVADAKTPKPRDPSTAPLGDMLWALAVSPEFQYIR